ncbi:hypothetical protein M404DRAFT_991193 [Pisolithus tinctorius Marx 270]|uniref:Uncharacterized protein n=1 Tax=Pisolithus tinctorius Marx 270 TaxID=870435 RepID=A0A0C3PYU4_PISTI|nr:hypothetical protein M404DRAFT_991193 [Pisolithus tinctorius Marx 270]
MIRATTCQSREPSFHAYRASPLSIVVGSTSDVTRGGTRGEGKILPSYPDSHDMRSTVANTLPSTEQIRYQNVQTVHCDTVGRATLLW